MSKILIALDGGSIMEIYTDVPEAEILIIDHDELCQYREDKAGLKRYTRLNRNQANNRFDGEAIERIYHSAIDEYRDAF